MSFLEPGRPARAWLLGPAALYGAAARLRNWGYDRGWFTAARLPVPVISVGNVTVGGTGKTPVVILLVDWLEAEGRRVAVLSRGYRRTGPHERVLVSDGTRLLAGPSEAGDEPFLIARRCPRAVVAVGSDRASLGRWVLDRFAVDWSSTMASSIGPCIATGTLSCWMRRITAALTPWCRPAGSGSRWGD